MIIDYLTRCDYVTQTSIAVQNLKKTDEDELRVKNEHINMERELFCFISSRENYFFAINYDKYNN